MKSVLETMSSFVSLIAIFFVIVGMFQSCQALNEAEESKERLKELQKEIEDQLQSGLIDEPNPKPIIRDLWS
jgi:hypothetical protein